MKRRKIKKTNPSIALLANKLSKLSKEQKANIWKEVSRILLNPSKNWAEVNVGKLERLTKNNDTVLIPGKLLASGTISHSVNVYAFKASENAIKLVSSAKGKVGKIEELIEKNPKGTGVRIIK